ncbi:MAG: radical SAM protein, partial [Desulfovibrio sp.]|nr:radical SAM protein [Desulfovibrio sp.]
LCIKSGIECYQNGLYSDAANMPLEDFLAIIDQCKGKTFQFALGGCGDPDQHEAFPDILAECFANRIVPNFTTSGYGLTKELADLCKKYCGAVAVSWYRSDYTLNAIHLLHQSGVKTNIHYVLNKNTIDEALQRLKDLSFPDGINALIFLLHKPIGLGSQNNIVLCENPSFIKFINYINASTFPFKIGFDSCTIPSLVQNPGNIDLDSLDTCEGARWSAYITPDLKMLPCSFDNQEQRWAVDLRKYSIQEAWHSEVFEDFRNHFRNSCPQCPKRNLCLGGCPICPEIVLCAKKSAS